MPSAEEPQYAVEFYRRNPNFLPFERLCVVMDYNLSAVEVFFCESAEVS